MAGQKKCEIGKSRRIQKRYEICMVSLRECTTYRIIILFISHCKFLTLQGFHIVYGSESCRRPLRVRNSVSDRYKWYVFMSPAASGPIRSECMCKEAPWPIWALPVVAVSVLSLCCSPVGLFRMEMSPLQELTLPLPPPPSLRQQRHSRATYPDW